MSDAGTPLVSDPGATLVAAAHAAGIRLSRCREPMPPLPRFPPQVSAAGSSCSSFPRRLERRPARVARPAGHRTPAVRALRSASSDYRDSSRHAYRAGGDRTVALGRELTKAHEELVVRPISERAAVKRRPREYAGDCPPSAFPEYPDAPTAESMNREFGQLTGGGGVSRRSAIKQLALKYGLSAGAVSPWSKGSIILVYDLIVAQLLVGLGVY